MEQSYVKIIGQNPDALRVCASAARISTTPGNALELFGRPEEPERDRTLIRKVLSSGHETIIEHAVFTLAFVNVSAVVEQFMIEFRLASFTVKSRRYVDFGSMGYYVPERLSGEALAAYAGCADRLFQTYSALVEGGIPKEDARFVLPYCFFSNFYCTVNARELLHILREIRWGRGRLYPELLRLAGQLEEQLADIAPWLAPAAACPPPEPAEPEPVRPPCRSQPELVSVQAELLDCPGAMLERLAAAWAVRHPGAPVPPAGQLVSALLRDGGSRELEALSVSFSIRNLTLSGLTHLVRHRMQSILVPSLSSVACGRYILPATIDASPLRGRYLEAMADASAVRADFLAQGRPEQVYLCLSGNTVDILSLMNARELLTFFRLRCCSRAQWEIREAADGLLEQLRAACPVLFNAFGPSCLLTGRCPEGRLSCGHPRKRAGQGEDTP